MTVLGMGNFCQFVALTGLINTRDVNGDIYHVE